MRDIGPHRRNRIFNTADDGNMIIFNQYAIGQAKAMIVPPANPHCVFLQCPQPGGGFARVDHPRLGMLYGLNVTTRQGGHA